MSALFRLVIRPRLLIRRDNQNGLTGLKDYVPCPLTQRLVPKPL